MSRPPSPSSPWTTWGKGVAAGLGVVAVLSLSAWMGVRLWLDAETVERRLAGHLSRPDREAAVTVGNAEALPLRRGVRVEDVTVRMASGPDGPGAIVFAASRAELQGVSLFALAFEDRLDAGRLRLERPSVVVSGPAAGAGAREDGEDRGAAAPGRGEPDPESREGDPAFSVDRLEVDGGRLAVRAPPEETTPGWEDRHRVEGLRLRLSDVSVGGPDTAGAGGLRIAGGGELRVERYRGLRPGEMHGVEAQGIAASSAGDSARVDSLRLLPLPDEEGFVRRLDHRKDRIHLVAGGIRGQGVDVGALMHRSGLRARRIDVGSLVILVHSDKRLPPGPEASSPEMPPALLRDAGDPIAIDTLRVEAGRVEYSERTAAATRPGRVGFEEVEATFLNVTNDSTRVGADDPAVVRTTARVYGEGRLSTEFRFPVVTRGLDFSFSGELGEMDPRSFNDMFVPVDGIHVREGHLERLAFEARVRDGTATGSVRGRYRDLDIEKVDPESGGQSIPDVVESLVLDAEIHSSNPASDDGEARTGTIENRRAAGDPFFHFLWTSLRSGLFSLLGV